MEALIRCLVVFFVLSRVYVVEIFDCLAFSTFVAALFLPFRPNHKDLK